MNNVPGIPSIDSQIDRSIAVNMIYGGPVKKVLKKKFEVESNKLNPIKSTKPQNIAILLDIEGNCN